ncbi:sugar phosphate isomerase/epimerase family protein [Flavihumibacter profundi]|uniref:sugar phosphate isomerase/epimerase family protein n=1 Tax=Flavihumibacter profundi TaxID=2716883 RepID=UPI001CC5B32E|nr:sugar phosphate isomerase/epimerase [Flavihumibacter profundi]MBZ5857191.1 sugar phosphate isomerase/epimerase [Flavihumibacter profundi]
MPVNIKKDSNQSRREFLVKGSLASVGLLMAGSSAWATPFFFQGKPDSKFFGVQIGVITYSFRSMPGNVQQILKYVTESGISAIELMGDAVEEYAGKPVNTVKLPPRVPGQDQQLTDEQKAQLAAYEKQVADWRATVSMDKFAEIKKMYNNAGVSIYAFKPNALRDNNTDAEIEYALKVAKTLGAKSVTVELPEDPAHSKRLGNLAAKHKVYIGYHAHTQATDTAWDVALGQSPYNSMNLDCGHYIAAGGNNTKETLLALITAKHDRITSMHIKDRRTESHGGDNMPWGQGDTPIKEILNLLKAKKYAIPATIELEYDIPAGSDAVKETHKCLEYAKKALGA